MRTSRLPGNFLPRGLIPVLPILVPVLGWGLWRQIHYPRANLAVPVSATVLSFSTDGKLLAAGDYNSVKVIDASTGETIRALQTVPGNVENLVFCQSSRKIAFAVSTAYGPEDEKSKDYRIRIYDVQSGRLSKILWCHSSNTDLCASPDGRYLASSEENGDVWVWDVATGKRVGYYHCRPCYSHALRFTPDGSRLLIENINIIADVDWRQRRLIHRYGPIPDSDQGSFLFYCSGSTVTALRGFTAQTFSLKSGLRQMVENRDDLTYLRDTSPASGRGLFHNSVTNCMNFGYRNAVWVRNLNGGPTTELHLRHGHGTSVYDVAMSPDGTRVAVSDWYSGDERYISIWNLSRGDG